MTIYYADDTVALHHGDMRQIVPTLGTFDCILTDPPYGETSLPWDRWPNDWPAVAALATKSMWCFGSMRMFLDRRDDFGLWRMSQDVVWEKHAGSGFAADRFKRIHEHALHWYLGRWEDVHHVAPRAPHDGPFKGHVRSSATAPAWHGVRQVSSWEDDGTRQVRSVIKAANLRGKAIHPTEKPAGVLTPLIEYACPPGGTVLDPFAGSGSTAGAARLIGRKTVLVEADERYCQVIANRLAQTILPIGGQT